MTQADRLLQIVGDIGDNKQNIRALWEHRKRLVPFVGAGLSMELSYPSWGRLLEALCPIGDDAVRTKVGTLLEYSKYEEAAEAVFDVVAPKEMRERIAELLDEKHLARPISGAVSILPRLAQGCVITTNLDRVLESAFEEARQPFQTVLSGAQIFSASGALQQAKHFLIKIHGDYRDPANWVLTLTQYKEVYKGKDADLPQVLTQALTGNVVLFIGCSLQTDQTMQVLGKVTKQYSVDHFAVLSETENRGERLRQLSEWRIRPIFFRKDQYGRIKEFLAGLAGVKQTGRRVTLAKPDRLKAKPAGTPPIASEIRMIRNFNTFVALNTKEKNEDSYGLYNTTRGEVPGLEELHKEFGLIEGSPAWSQVDAAIKRVGVLEDAGQPGGVASDDQRVVRDYAAMLRRCGRVLDFAFVTAAVLRRVFQNSTLEVPLERIADQLGLRKLTSIADKEALLTRILFKEIVDRAPAVLEEFRESAAAENWLPERQDLMQKVLYKLSTKAQPEILSYQADEMVASYDVPKAWNDCLSCFTRRIVNGVLNCPADLNGLLCAIRGDYVPRIFGPTQETSLIMWGHWIGRLVHTAFRRRGPHESEAADQAQASTGWAREMAVRRPQADAAYWLLVGFLAEVGFRNEAIRKLSGADELPTGVEQWGEAIANRAKAEQLDRVLILCMGDWSLLLGWKPVPSVAALALDWYSWSAVSSDILEHLPHFDYIFFEERGADRLASYSLGPDRVESGISEFYNALPDDGRKAAFRSIPAFVLSPKDPQAQIAPPLPRIFRASGFSASDLEGVMEEARSRLTEGKTIWDTVLDSSPRSTL